MRKKTNPARSKHQDSRKFERFEMKGKPVYIQLRKPDVWRTIICAQGQKG